MRISGFVAAGALLGGVVMVQPALAQDEGSGVTFSGEATFVSDYRFRGISLSNRKPAVQAGIEMETQPGFYAGIWGSSIEEFNGATVELNLYGGWRGSFGPITTDVGILGYIYPGGSDTDLYELYGAVSGTVGPAELTVGLNIAPNQGNLDRSSRYLYFGAGVGIPDTPVTLKGNLGFERGGLVADDTGRTTKKTDWLIGADFVFEPLTVGIAYVGNDLPRRFVGVAPGVGPVLPGERANDFAKNTVVVTLSIGF
ncbi:MAG: TorF family putative porin [Thermaurantiacus sp.]